MANVTIGQEFFAKAKNDYSNWLFAWVREAFQNAADSGATQIKISFVDNKTTVAIVEDNGCGMTEDTLVNKLFSLGSSGKDFKSGAVGGFGKAKELLYFGQKAYQIRTNDLHVSGVGGTYEIERKGFEKGTKSTVALDSESRDVETWSKYAAEVVGMSEFAGEVELNGFRCLERTKKGPVIKEFACATVHGHSGNPEKIIFRVNGSPMFTHMIKNLKQGLVIEIKSPCTDYLAANRDSLTYEARKEIEPFLTELAIDKMSALQKPEHVVTQYKGKKGKLRLSERAAAVVLPLVKQRVDFKVKQPVDFQQSLLDYDFVVYHAKVEPLPVKWQVDTLCENAQWVAWAWSAAVWEVFVSNGKKPEFGFGFVFDDHCEARYRFETFLLNPCHTDYKIKYTRTRKHACSILALATHEYIHHLGYGVHDESYASVFTDVIAKVMFNSPHIIAKMLDSISQAGLLYEDSKSRTAFLD